MSTASPLLRLELQTTGGSDIWGAALNEALKRVEESVAGVTAISTTGGTTTLTSSNYVADQSRAAILNISGTLVSNATIVVPNVSKPYRVINRTTGAFTVTIKTASVAGVVVTQSCSASVYVDSTDGSVRFTGPITRHADGLLDIARINALQSTLDTDAANLAAHIANTSNPHSVTKAQVGLGSVDNTPDSSKPVSTAQAAADTAVANAAAAALAAHVAAADPHTGYALDSDLAAHAAAGDPHPAYALEADLASTTDATKGAALIQMKPSETGGVALPVATIFKRLELMPEQFGAVGNGTTDDSTALTNTLAACKANKARMRLWADYNIASSGLSIDYPAHIIGPGKIIRPNNTSTPIITCTTGSDHTVIEGLRMTYTNASTTASVAHCAVRITAGDNVRVVENWIDGGGKLYAGIVSETTSTLETYFEGNNLKGIVNRPIYVYLGSKRIRIIGNSIDGYVSTTPTTDYGINLNDGGVAPSYEIIIAGNIVRGTNLQAIEAGNTCERLVVSNNVIESTSTSGSSILVQIANGSRGRKAFVTGNYTKGFGNGVYVYQSDDVIVSNNFITDTASAVLCTDSTGVLVDGNMSLTASSCHYWFANADDCSFLNNRSRGGAAAYDLIVDASSDKFRYDNNARYGGSGVYSVAGTNISTGTNT